MVHKTTGGAAVTWEVTYKTADAGPQTHTFQVQKSGVKNTVDGPIEDFKRRYPGATSVCVIEISLCSSVEQRMNGDICDWDVTVVGEVSQVLETFEVTAETPTAALAAFVVAKPEYGESVTRVLRKV